MPKDQLFDQSVSEFKRQLNNLGSLSNDQLLSILQTAEEEGDMKSVQHILNFIKSRHKNSPAARQEKYDRFIREGMKVGSTVRNGDMVGQVRDLRKGDTKVLVYGKTASGKKCSNWVTILSLELIEP